MFRSYLLAVAAVLLVGAAGAAAARPAELSPAQRRVADKLVSQFENGTSKIQYCYIEALRDGRG